LGFNGRRSDAVRVGFNTAMRDERGSDRERRDERRKDDCGYRHIRCRSCAQLVFSSLISLSRYLSSLIAVLKPPLSSLIAVNRST
jgi:hypothetical protein